MTQPDGTRSTGGRVLASDWYAAMLGDGFTPLGAALDGAFPRWLARLAREVPPLRGLLAFLLAADFRGAALIRAEPGLTTLLVLEAVIRRRRATVILELIARRPERRVRRAVYRTWSRLVVHPAMRHAVAGAQVLTRAERARYADGIGIEAARLRFIPWAFMPWAGPNTPNAAPGERAGVLASGRPWCDWETLFAAAEGRDWPLTVVHGEADRKRVAALNAAGRADALCEIPRDEHERLLRGAAVYVIALAARAPSAGHVRLMAATGAGTAVVATRVAALEDYVEEGASALLVAPGDADALGAAIDHLIAAPAERERLVAAALGRARRWTYAEYFSAIRGFVVDVLPR